ncbi:MAG: ATP-binding protein, partial [Gammaproteobacteria bacterium]|nr:ATP-binding protein [Gammaproteobacteria bacterium]
SGMDEEFIRERLFKPFDSTKGPRGMGIGAYQVRDYVKTMGGRVNVYSEPGSGSCFEILLPLDMSFEKNEAVAADSLTGTG